MNKLEGKIAAIKSSENLSEVSIILNTDTCFNIFLVETPKNASYLKPDQKVTLLFKETEVIISKDFNSEISVQNKLKAEIIKIEKGKILSEIQLKTAVGEIKSLVSTSILELLDLKQTQEVIILVKANEIMLSQ